MTTDTVERIPAGLCQCGCGERTGVWGKTHLAFGRIKGEPKRFIHNHHGRKSPVEYVEEGRGLETPCWVWQRATDSSGYGMCSHPDRRGSVRAFKIYYERANGPVPEGLELDHLCRVRACVNPDHLEPVTHAENMRRAKCVKLGYEAADEMRRLHATGAYGIAQLGRMFGVNRNWASKVIKGKRWAREEIAMHRNDERKGS